MLTLAAIRDAQVRIKPHILRTPLISSPTFSEMTNTQVSLKLETLQIAGSFKIRGALNAILCAIEKNPDLKGVIAASAGNHAQGVAVAAKIAGVKATIFMPGWASLTKQEATRGYGAEVVITGSTIDECAVEGIRRAGNDHLFVHPFNDSDVIAGQGTIGLEIIEDLPDVDVIIVPVGGGGLISGIACAVKTLRPSCIIIGVQAVHCPSASQALREGGPACVSSKWTLADGIRVNRTGDLAYPVIRDLVDSLIEVDEDQIATAVLALMERKRVIAEGAGAAPLAALISGKCQIRKGSRVAVIISGGNIDTHQFGRTISHGLTLDGRIFRFFVELQDHPGSLVDLLAVIGKEGGNILQIHHTTTDPQTPADYARVEIELETRGSIHLRIIRAALEERGYRLFT
ncbi:threonine ammonia-lyase [uncultured Methanospirillum sp.]|uniref:threonine ammonia-lyase n=1 Tax=uncultured Methanospirillum sp. TaxID=262503 RepID=UPI0029C93DAF|nr:threonine ammonia-lyase [uncultured Methanospirillum sp.]